MLEWGVLRVPRRQRLLRQDRGGGPFQGLHLQCLHRSLRRGHLLLLHGERSGGTRDQCHPQQFQRYKHHPIRGRGRAQLPGASRGRRRVMRDEVRVQPRVRVLCRDARRAHRPEVVLLCGPHGGDRGSLVQQHIRPRAPLVRVPLERHKLPHPGLRAALHAHGNCEPDDPKLLLRKRRVRQGRGLRVVLWGLPVRRLGLLQE
mmetsp:Transcript_7198/g.18369  ORF Transcript_7198/g.18369 Transcript_7198/m.18369 type:complete len:202 (+) Transcript_7198:373-978(+)